MNRLLQWVSDNAIIIMIGIGILFTAAGIWDNFYGPVVSGYAHMQWRAWH